VVKVANRSDPASANGGITLPAGFCATVFAVAAILRGERFDVI
jgi:hypothetical protein